MSDTLKLITTPDAGTLILQPTCELTWQTATALRAWFEEYASDPGAAAPDVDRHYTSFRKGGRAEPPAVG
ncbi:hypothetical protein AB0B45_47370 [Nonomuraea sp. NPDC049152]|uniref:hypothetical protein n=1 Tax=Nonomuraea sp. NPDC049152 TaxID=3154350 RepID=UPI0033D686AF